MSMFQLDRQRLDTIIRAVGDELEGEWLLVGGAAVALWLEPRRLTEDVDLVGLTGGPDERYQLFDLADRLGLPVEALNSAADFFVRRIPGYRSEMEVLYRGVRSVVYRPTATLLLLLKLRRLSERDLEDCLLAVARARVEGVGLDSARLQAALEAEPPAGAERGARLLRLRAALDA